MQSDYVGLADCDKLTTPECIRALYDFHYELKVPEKNSIGVGECEHQGAMVVRPAHSL